MTVLFNLANEYLQLAERLAECDFDPQTVADTIESSGIIDELAIKAQNLEYVARAALANHAVIDSEIERLQELKAKRDKIAKSLRDYLKDNMQRCGIDRLDCPLFSISVRKNPPAVDVFDLVSLPKEYWTKPEPKPPVPAPDKAAIKLALQAGKEVTGARLVQSTRLDVR